jgi:K+-sensing histidine kinase KdpD
MSVQLSNEIMIQQALIKTGMPQYKPFLQQITLSQIIYDIKNMIANQPASTDNKLVIPESISNITITSDLSLVCRVLTNMLVNAFESSSAEDVIKLGIETDVKNIVFSV